MLTKSKRDAVPIRRAFLQRPPTDAPGGRGALLADLVRTRDASALDAYLLIRALASAEPFEVQYPVLSWVRALGLENTASADAARAHWAKITARLVQLGLIRRDRRGNQMAYVVLREDGSGLEYTRPKSASDGHWFALPHAYWTEGLDQTLSLPEKALLLVALDQQEGFQLPTERTRAWYGLSTSTATRGLAGLRQRELLSYSSGWRLDLKSKTGWAEERHYTLLGAFSTDARAELRTAARTRTPRGRTMPIYFEPDQGHS